MLGQLKRRYGTKALIQRYRHKGDVNLPAKAIGNFNLFTEGQNNTKQNDDHTEQTITQKNNVYRASVQCPHCQTKFSVPQEFATTREELKFHCPRCETIFASEIFVLDGGLDQKNSHLEENNYVEESTEETSEQNIESNNYEDEENISVSCEIELNESPTSEEIYNLNNSEQISFLNSESNEANSIGRELHPTEIGQIDLPFMFGIKARKNNKSAPIANSNSLISRLKINKRPSAPIYPTSSIEVFAANKIEIESNTKTESKNFLTCLRNACIIPIPAICAVLLFSILTLIANYSTTTQKKLLNIFTPSLPTAAPAGLSVENLKTENIWLDNGDGIFLISGDVKNYTARTIKNISVEIVAFNSEGQTIATKLVNIGKTLADAKLKTLTPELINQMQEFQNNSRFLLKPDHKEKFTLALFKDQLPDLKFFNARIYSVRLS